MLANAAQSECVCVQRGFFLNSLYTLSLPHNLPLIDSLSVRHMTILCGRVCTMRLSTMLHVDGGVFVVPAGGPRV